MADDITIENGNNDGNNLLSMPGAGSKGAPEELKPVRVLLLDDDPANLLLRAAILRQNGYESLPAGTIEEANELLESTDIAVLDYHLGAGKFGTAVAAKLRQRRPEVPIIILSATLERRFGGMEDMHLLKGHSSVDDLLSALRGLEAKRRGAPVVVDAREFYYSRIAMAIGVDVLVQILDPEGNWHYVNESTAEYLEKPRDWFPGRNIFAEMSNTMRDWRDVLYAVSTTRETYIDRTRRGLLMEPREEEGNATWSVLAFPIMLHDGRSGVVLSARILDRHSGNAFA
ncbi:response regulator containing a CheY-like receiver domain and an HD-GYP domain [Terriglobus roseus DSM 18391]|uniref:Response regulator containing a CheY-like receiver domain and an HD-GYP domain n=1 Tax=Terriglobus roseus (strain DSM 18391 / NRRL B-41598 / KBS 63) TaxID=926566 RepID=I3ZG35_TERRK|nr:response regulator [Terriglobus roseus]AFL88203.1 response regulator containing a CheY-like receiver domain and an HD-GYP domain [Terriglobus roseus DSM 18391]